MEEHTFYKRSLANKMQVYRKEIIFYWDRIDKTLSSLFFLSIHSSLFLCTLIYFLIYFQKII